MKNIFFYITVLSIITLFNSCSSNNNKADAYGNFEATETIVSAEGNGKLLQFTVEEGQLLKKNEQIGVIDTLQISLKKEQLKANKISIQSKSKNVLSQIRVLKEQLHTAKINQSRIQKLVAANAGTQKQLDNINGEVSVLKEKINSIETQNSAVLSELKGINAQINLLNDQINKSIIKNPVLGTVLVKYAEPNEITAFGKPLYKIANLNSLELKSYVTETQLANFKIGQKVKVLIDLGEKSKNYEGKITWIADEAEFTPKIIQTKEERVNLVYAIKVTVQNDGFIKIGMPGEVWFN